MELNIGAEDPVDSIMRHIRVSSDDVLTHVFSLAEAPCAASSWTAPEET
ncbi:hypothetical protein ACFXAZ_38005 [Streptomyces sp. NPDC059477]